MSSVTLAPFLAFPLHVESWASYGRDRKGSIDYRVTNTFSGPDLVNGGAHRAVDVGNTRRGDQVRSPITGKVRGLKHTDGALGAEFLLGGVVTLELWHLDKVYPAPVWTDVRVGEPVGVTGATGGTLQNGTPMPAHTHIALKLDGLPVDPEPHLPMVERPAIPILLEEEMKIPPGSSPLAIGVVGAGNRLRKDPHTTEGSRVLEQAYQVQVFTYGVLGEPYSLAGGGNTYALVGQFGEMWYVAEPLLGGVFLTDRAPRADCTAQDNKIAAARTAVAGAAQAIAAAQRSLA